LEPANGILRTRIWRFGPCEYDEHERKLWVEGKLANVTDKPMEVLAAILRSPEKKLSKDQLLDLAWPSEDGSKGSEDSLAKAVSQLREALPEQYRITVIRTVRGFGYELGVPVASRTLDRTVEPGVRLHQGMFVPGKAEWKLIRALDAVPPHQVWLAELSATHQTHVFKFAEDGFRLQALQKEITLSRFFEKAVSDSSSFVKVHYWRLNLKPYLVEAEYGGLNLAEWAEGQRGTSGLSREDRINIVADLAEAVATAHGLGVLHNDLKPSNILISPKSGTEPGWKVKVCDFGIASLAEPERLEDFDISNHGFSDRDAGVAGGSVLYRAPEVRPGKPSTVAADIAVGAKQNPKSFMAIGGVSDAALAECRVGKFDAGEAHAREALKDVSSPGQDQGLAGAVDFSLASCLLLSQSKQGASPARLAEAEHLLSSINIQLVDAVTGDPGWGSNVDLAKARIALDRHQLDLAAESLAAAKPALNGLTADPYQRKAAKKLEQDIAEARAKRGN
jgi:DNA-binding winged helix-turn-helix (wHTH) protein/tRNA A-37 threonylcarbamoyl transferase component Bud32